MPKPVIYYIRHGETAWNAAGRFQGVRDIPLNELGQTQAAQAGGILNDLLARDGRPAPDHAFVASPLGRARHTMELVRGALQMPPDGYALDDRLREIAYGEWEGSTLAQMQVTHPELYATRETDKWNVPPPDGESYASVVIRMQEWYRSLQGDTVAVAHGGTARALMVALGVETPEGALEVTIQQGAVYVFADGGLARYS
jgi:broad specificity phosphatase PhoE